MLCLTASAASSRGVQWLVGRSLPGGGSQATATTWTICSGAKWPGAPGRGGVGQQAGEDAREVAVIAGLGGG